MHVYMVHDLWRYKDCLGKYTKFLSVLKFNNSTTATLGISLIYIPINMMLISWEFFPGGYIPILTCIII